MKIPPTHRWDVSPEAAAKIQRELATRVIERDAFGEVRWIAGVDVGLEGDDNQIARAAVVVLRASDLVPVEASTARLPIAFPYIPGLLAFREIPVILQAFEQLHITPDLIVVDGQGRAHPRRMGIACHLGVLLDLPMIGCAKSILCGRAETPRDERGAWSPLTDHGEQIGAALRTRVGVTPVYVSIGHRISLSSAIRFVIDSCTRYRLPETTRWAHRVAGGATIPSESAQERLL